MDYIAYGIAIISLAISIYVLFEIQEIKNLDLFDIFKKQK